MIRYTRIPHSIRILLTNRCNLHCNFCLNDASSKCNKEELNTAEWLKFFERLKVLRIFNVILSGGEVFLRSDLFVLLERLRENRMHRIALLTNGTLITKKIADKLSRIKIKRIAVSVDGFEEKHDQMRGKGAFQDAIRGIRNLIAVGIKPQVSFTPTRDNYKDLGPLIDFLVSMGIVLISVNTLTPEGRCLNIYKDLVLKYPEQVKEVLDVLEERRIEYPDLKIDCGFGFYYHLPQLYRNFQKNPQETHEKKHLKDGCGAASTSCTITPTGHVIPCEGFSMFKGGNIKEQDFLVIWNKSENLKMIRDLGKKSMDEVPFCKECKYNFLCDAGCRAAAYLIYKDLLAPSILCPYWKGDRVIKNFENEYRERLRGD